MKTKIIHISKDNPDLEIIKQAARLIQTGQLVAFPTETVYGLGANAFNSKAVQSIFSVKQRPSSDPLIVHIQDKNDISSVAQNIPEIAFHLADQFWPGPLTLILEKHPHIPLSVTAEGLTVAVRLPAHPIAQLLIRQSSCPIAAPSANRFSRPSPTLAKHVYEDLGGKIPMIIDAGATDIGLESTVLDLNQKPPKILRPGGVLFEELACILPDIQVCEQYLDSQNKTQPSPGQLFKHYAPKARLLLFSGNQTDDVLLSMKNTITLLLKDKKTVGLLVTDDDVLFFKNMEVVHMKMGTSDNLEMIGKNLFACMREIDARDVDYILMRMPSNNGLGMAIQDRLIRAAYKIIQ